MPKEALTHEENRKRVCLFCLKKCSIKDGVDKNKMRPITAKGKIDELINTIVKYDSTREELPNAICNSCCVKLYNKKLNAPDLLQFKPLNTITRSYNSILCQCLVCEIARSTINSNSTGFKKGICS